jgi:hypothetical protein
VCIDAAWCLPVVRWTACDHAGRVLEYKNFHDDPTNLPSRDMEQPSGAGSFARRIRITFRWIRANCCGPNALKSSKRPRRQNQ